jgi:hypothetical protein
MVPLTPTIPERAKAKMPIISIVLISVFMDNGTAA